MFEFSRVQQPPNKKTFPIGPFSKSSPRNRDMKSRIMFGLEKGSNSPSRLETNTMDSHRSNQPNVFKNSSSIKNRHIESFDDYHTLITESMANYHTEKTDITENKEKNKNCNSLMGIKNKDLQKTALSKGYLMSEESMLKVSINSLDYRNPLESSKVLSKNKRIFEDVSQSFLYRQGLLYDDAIDNFDNFTMKYTNKLPVIKVTSLMPKIDMVIPKIKDDDNNNYSDHNKNSKKSKKKLMYYEELKVDKSPKLFGYYKYPCKNFPEGREQFAFCFDLTNLVVWGGIASNKNSDVWSLNPDSLEWVKLRAASVYPQNTRYGHSGVLFQNKLYVFGGKSKNNDYTFIPDLEYYNLETDTWTSPLLNSQLVLKLRKNHIAEIVGHQMIIHGGNTESNEYLNDVFLLNFSPLKWVTCSINEDTPGPYLSGHAAALVVPAEIRYNSKFSVYRIPDLGIGRINLSRIREKGWYIFGGRHREDDGISNDLWILRFGKKPLEWIKPHIHGTPPPPRYSHSLNYYEKGNYLIMHGGRNDLSSESFALNDTYVFDLQKFEWSEVKIYSDLKKFNIYNRCGHSALVYTNKLIIFGGMNNENYLGSSLLVVHLDFNSKPIKLTDAEKEVELLKKNIHMLGSDGFKKLEKLTKKSMRRQISKIDDFALPDIK